VTKTQAVRITGAIGSIVARHALATAVTVIAACVVWTVTYLTLLFWALVTNSGLGSPLSYPAGLLFIALISLAGSLILLLPSTALAELLAKTFRLPILAQLPISLAFLALLCTIAAFSTVATASVPLILDPWKQAALLFLTTLVPLGVYWWTVQCIPLLIALFRKLSKPFRPAETGEKPTLAKKRVT